MKKVLIVQTYLPQYRVDLFVGLTDFLQSHGVEPTIIAGQPPGSQIKRMDQGSVKNLRRRSVKSIKLFGIRFESLIRAEDLQEYDAVVLPLAASFVDNFKVLLSKRLKVALWGHVAAYTKRENVIDGLLELFLMRRSDRIFAYTESGKRSAVARGIPHSKIDVLMNTTSTAMLEQMKISTNVGAVSVPMRPFLVLGGLDSSKRIDFLVQTLQHVVSLGERFHVVVVGSGEDAGKFDPLVDSGHVTMLGYDAEMIKNEQLLACKAILNPGRIGLVAVDALASGKPILSTHWKFHAPEFEYLTPGESVFQSEDSVQSYADLILSFIHGEDKQPSRWPYPSLDDMVTRFGKAILKLVEL